MRFRSSQSVPGCHLVRYNYPLSPLVTLSSLSLSLTPSQDTLHTLKQQSHACAPLYYYFPHIIWFKIVFGYNQGGSGTIQTEWRIITEAEPSWRWKLVSKSFISCTPRFHLQPLPLIDYKGSPSSLNLPIPIVVNQHFVVWWKIIITKHFSKCILPFIWLNLATADTHNCFAFSFTTQRENIHRLFNLECLSTSNSTFVDTGVQKFRMSIIGELTPYWVRLILSSSWIQLLESQNDCLARTYFRKDSAISEQIFALQVQ